MLDGLAAVGKRNKVQPDRKDLDHNRKVFEVHIKAQIARKLWGNNSFYPIFNDTNEILQESIKMFDKVPEISKRKM
jgi:carboxyl-terminal processing protease